MFPVVIGIDFTLFYMLVGPFLESRMYFLHMNCFTYDLEKSVEPIKEQTFSTNLSSAPGERSVQREEREVAIPASLFTPNAHLGHSVFQHVSLPLHQSDSYSSGWETLTRRLNNFTLHCNN